MNVYGVGPPRSGTTMLAECLNIVRETHHQCGDIHATARANFDAWRGLPVDMSVYGDHGSEVSCFLTFVADRLDGKIIHLWRPAEVWLDSAEWLGIGRREGRMFPWGHLVGLSPSPNNHWDRLAWMYREYHTFLLSLPNTYVVTPDRIVWEDLFDWLNWDVTQEQIRAVQAHQRTRPNNAPHRGQPQWDHSFTDNVEALLEERTKYSRYEARHPL